MVKIAVCDDEKELREMTAAWLRDYFAPQEVLLSLYDGGEALLRAVREENCRFQLAVLDIELGDTDGITVGEELNLLLPACQIIYLTGYLDYAPDVYATRHVYYVYRPRMEEHLPKALEMALAALHEAENSRLVLPQKNGQLVLEKREITRLERRLRVTNIHTADGECVSAAAPLDDLLTQLDSPSFLRCHNSFAVNLSHVAAFRRESFLMKDGTVVPISHAYYAAVREEFQKYHSGDL